MLRRYFIRSMYAFSWALSSSGLIFIFSFLLFISFRSSIAFSSSFTANFCSYSRYLGTLHDSLCTRCSFALVLRFWGTLLAFSSWPLFHLSSARAVFSFADDGTTSPLPLLCVSSLRAPFLPSVCGSASLASCAPTITSDATTPSSCGQTVSWSISIPFCPYSSSSTLEGTIYQCWGGSYCCDSCWDFLPPSSS
jgi:hypothetical protein